MNLSLFFIKLTMFILHGLLLFLQGLVIVLILYGVFNTLFEHMPVDERCRVYESSIGRLPHNIETNLVSSDGLLSSLLPLKETCQILQMEKWNIEYGYYVRRPLEPEPEPFEGGYSLSFQDHHDQSMTVWAGPDREGNAVVFKYYPGLGKMERLDDTIASICPALPPSRH